MAIVLEVRLQSFMTIGSRRVFLEVDVLIFHGTPQSFNRDVVNRSTFAVHADGNRFLFQSLRKDLARELRSLIRVEDFQLALLQRFLQGLKHKTPRPCCWTVPGQYVAAVPIHNGRQTQISPTHRNERDVARTHLIGSNDFNTSKQVGINLVTGCSHRRSRTRCERLKPHFPQ